MKTIIKYLFLLLMLSVYALADPSTPNLISSDDNGNSNTDNRTSDTTLTFTGTKSYGEYVTLYRDGTHIGFDDSNSTSYSITDNAGTSGNYYAVGYTTSSSLYVEVVTSGYSGSVYINDVTVDNNINMYEDDGFVTVSGTASGGDILTGDNVYTTINGVPYNTSLSSSGTWSFSVPGSDIIADWDFNVYVDSWNNEFGFPATSSGYKSVGTDNTASFSIISVQTMLQSNWYTGEHLVDGIEIQISTDIEDTRERTILINGIEYSFDDYNNYLFIKNSDLSLSDGTSYTITSKFGLTDAAGNTAPQDSFLFTYDKVANNPSNAKPINIGTAYSNLYSGDEDYFLLSVPKKGKLTLSTSVGTVTLKNLDNTDITTSATSSTILVEEGSYLVYITSAIGNYTLTTSLEEYGDEIDVKATLATPTEQAFATSAYGNNMYIDGDVIYYAGSYKVAGGQFYTLNFGDDSNKFVVKDGNYIYANGSTLEVKSLLTSHYVYSQLAANGQSVSVVDNIAYVLVGTAVERHNISNYSSITKDATDISLPTISSTYDEILAYKDGSNLYIYAKDINNIVYLFDVTNPTSVITLKVFNNYGVNDFAIDNGLLYMTTDIGNVFVYDINTDASNPRQILKFSPSYTPQAIDAHGGKVYVTDGSNIYKYDLDFDFDDTVPVNPQELSKVKVGSIITVNKFADANGTADTDIFRIDTEYFGSLSFTTSGVIASDLSITVDDNSDFLSPLATANGANIKNTTLSGGDLDNLLAGTYYVKISSTDTDSFDDYSLITTLTKVDTVVDKLLNISLNKATPISIGVNTTVTIDNANDIDLYKIIIPSDGELTLTPAGPTVSLESASIDATSSYAILTNIATLNPIKAGTYYIKATVASGSFTTSFTSYDSTDEYSKALSVSNVTTEYSATTNSVNMDGALINSARTSGIGRLSADNFLPLSNKNYLSQVSDGEYIYALYRHTYSLDGITNITEIGVDKLEYINDNKTILISSSVVNGSTSEIFGYRLKYANSKLYIRTESNWLEYGTTTSFLSSDYLDFEIFEGITYAVTSTTVEQIGSSLSTTFNNIQSIEVVDGIVYVGTGDDGIKALDISTLNLVKEIRSFQDITSLESIGNKLYVLENKSSLNTIDIERDFGDDFANAHLIDDGDTISARILSGIDIDSFKINIDYTASLTTSLDVGTCELFDSSLSSKGSCTNPSLLSGIYYLKVTNATSVKYNLTSNISIINSDQQDTTRFYDGNTILTADINSTVFGSNADALGDIDMFRIYLDSSGYITLNNGAVLVYENGTPVPMEGGQYVIENAGFYYIKTTDITADISATFTSVIDDKYIDNANAENETLSTLATNGSASKIISSGKYVYLVDEVDGLSIIDLTDVQDPIITSRVNLRGTPKDIYLDGSIVYVALGDDGFAVVDVSDINSAFLYSQTNISEDVSNIVANGNEVFISTSNNLKKYDVINPTEPSFIGEITLAGSADILVDGTNILVAYTAGVVKLKQSDLSTIKTASLTGAVKFAKDGDYVFVENSNQSINILNLSNLSDTGKTISLSESTNDIYVNNKILYLSKDNGYEIIEYKNIENIIPTSYGYSSSDGVNSISVSNSSLIFAKDKNLKIAELTPDYADSTDSQNINTIEIESSEAITGQFSTSNDIDAFHYINNFYTGTLNISVTADNPVEIKMFDSDGNQLGSTLTDSISKVINADDVYIQIKSVSGNLDAYSIVHTYDLDGVYDLLDDSLSYNQISQGQSIVSTLYEGGADKDYFELTMTERGTISFDTNNDQDIKITLLYKSGTVIASNYDEQTGLLETEFEADLSSGDYMVLVENFEPQTNESAHSYEIDTSFTPTSDVVLDSGASAEPLTNISAFSYVDRHSYMLRNGVLTRLSNILEPKQELILDGFDDPESKYSLFSYNVDDQERIFISKINSADASLNKVVQVWFRYGDDLQLDYADYDMSGISEEIMLYMEDDYAYYYDDDSLYISSLHYTVDAEQIAIDGLNIVKVQGNYMYLASDKEVLIVDISNKEDIDNSKVLSTINVENVKSIYVDKTGDRLFISANNKIEIYNISDKESVELLSEFTIGFNNEDLWYEGTASSMYMLNNKFYTTVEGVGIIIFSIDEFNALSIETKILNLGENLTQIYTFHGEAINYVIDNELKVWFTSTNILDSDSAGTYSIVEESSIDEGKIIEGCFIATAAYGSYFEDEVKVLRNFRDEYLKTTYIGRIFIDIYYEYSPLIAYSISDNEVAKYIVRTILTPLVFMIKYPSLFAVFIFILLARKIQREKSTRLGHIQ